MVTSPDTCPDENAIVAFVDGQASDADALAFETHLDICPDCRALVSEFGRSASIPDSSWDAHSAGDIVGPGAKVGRYEILERVGSGAMGVVFRARDPELDRDVALKLVRVLGLGPAEAEQARVRLLREAIAMAKLSDPNVVAVYEASVVGDSVFIAMEFVDGANLDAWLESQNHTWQDVVDCFIEAGRGLAAAHAANVLHRDFKPANVLVGPKGRVRVTDFGLATRVGVHASEGVSATSREGTSVRGTPAYMSPEALDCGVLDARSDQYSFGVSLCEALCGHRPEAGVMPAISAPARISRIIRRSLQKKPQNRFASMVHLVDALVRARRFRKRVIIGTVAAAVLLGAGGIGFRTAAHSEGPTCGSGEEQIAALWNLQSRTAAESAFAATELAYAPDVFATASANLDAFGREWAASYLDACEDSHLRHEQSDALLDLRMQCLHDELRPLGTAVELFARARPAIVNRAISISRVGDGLKRCQNLALLKRETARPGGAEADAEIERISEAYGVIRGLGLEGKQSEALAESKALLVDAKAVGYKRMEAAIVGHIGELQWRTGDIESAVRNLYEGVAAAELANANDIRGGTLSTLVAVIGFEQARYGEALEIAHIAELALRGIEDQGRLANLMSNRGSIYFAKGEYDKATAEYNAAHAIMQSEYPANDARMGQILNNLALMHEQGGEHQQAAERYSEALKIYENALGASHPQIALSLANRATSLMNLEKVDEALLDIERALAIRIEALGPEHASVGETHRIMAQFANAAGQPERALKSGRLAESILIKALDAKHPEIASLQATNARSLLELGQHAEALAMFRSALEIWGELDASSPLISMTRFHMARAMWEVGADRAAAVAIAKQALVEMEGEAESVERIETWLRSRP